MNVKTYTPQPGSLASQVVGFFTFNHDEHLTLDDITSKFDCTRGNIHTILRTAVEAGLLVRAKDDDGEYIYKRGPQAAPAPSGVKADKAPAAPARAPAATNTKNMRKHVDIDALQVDDDVPYMASAPRTGSKWDALFDKLQKVNQSATIPGHCKAAVSAAALKRNKKARGTFKVSMTTKPMLGCGGWRERPIARQRSCPRRMISWASGPEMKM